MDEEKTGIDEVVSKKPAKVVSPKKSTLTDNLRENPWMVATLVLGVIVLIFLISSFTGGVTGASVAVANSDEVSAKVLSFVNSQVDTPAELVETNIKNGLYEIVVLYQGQEIPLYATLDGENLVQGVTPIDELLAAAQGSTDSTGQTTGVVQSDKPHVELFVMSMCPYGTQAEKGLLSVLELLGDKIDFDLRFVSYAMHGKDEIDENTVQYCVQKEQPSKLYDYLRCYLADSDTGLWSACLTDVGINKAAIDSCVASADKEFKITELFNDKSSWRGGTYPQYNVDEGLNTQYGVSGSPTLVINGVQVSSARDSASYLATICSAFTDAPEECSTKLSSTSPSPGFGWTTSGTTTTTAAQCA